MYLAIEFTIVVALYCKTGPASVDPKEKFKNNIAHTHDDLAFLDVVLLVAHQIHKFTFGVKYALKMCT